MSADEDGSYAINAVDLEPVIELLLARKAAQSADIRDEVHHIVSDLKRLPNLQMGQFSVTFLNRVSSGDDELGGGSEWVSIDAGDDGLAFTVGSHVRYPGIGGDSSSDTLFECWPSGGSTGDLHNWLAALASMDRSSMEISAVHENMGNDAARRNKLMAACEKASRDPRLTAEMRANAMHSLNNLKAISRIGEPIKSEPEGDDDRSEQVRLDHNAHKFALFVISAYGWQLHSWFVGLLVLIGLFATISLTNIAILAVAPEKRLFALLRWNRWGWVVIAGIALAYSGSSLVSG